VCVCVCVWGPGGGGGAWAERGGGVDAEVEHIQNYGLYDKSFNTILPYMNYDRSYQWLTSNWQTCWELYLQDEDEAGAAMVMVRRPQYDPGAPTEVVYLPAIPDCDTKSWTDNKRIYAECRNHSPGVNHACMPVPPSCTLSLLHAPPQVCLCGGLLATDRRFG
jgi:hypothetical protein